MKKFIVIIIITLVIFHKATAQVGKVGINTTSPAAMLHVKDSSVVFTGPATLPSNAGQPPVNGAGNRIMWYADKAAFRAGHVSGSEWDKDYVGQYSMALGYNTIALGTRSISIGHTNDATGTESIALGRLSTASGAQSVAIGMLVSASGTSSTAMGYETQATGSYSTAMGYNTDAVGTRSTALGSFTTASGIAALSTGSQTEAPANFSFSAGISTDANAYGSAAFGRYNVNDYISSTQWIEEDPLFVIGNGTAESVRSNAFTVLKNGNVGIGNAAPEMPLSFSGTGNKISLYENNGNHFGFGIQTSLLQIFAENNIGDIAFGYGNSNAFTEKMRIKGNGNVGIGTSTPGFLLNFANSHGDKISLWGNSGAHFGFGIQASVLQIHTDAVGSDIVFGYGTSAALTETMRVKGNGRVGIGTNSPAFKLDVADRIRLRTGPGGESAGIWLNKADNTAAVSFIGMYNDNHVGIYSELGASWNFLMNLTNGNIGIGISPTQKLHVSGNGLFTGTVTASCGVLVCSDIRYKTNIRPLTNSLSNVLALRGIYYDWKKEAYPEKQFDDKSQIGFAAQDLEKIYPEMVHTDDEGFKTVDYSRLTPVLVEAIKEQQSQIDLLTSELNELKEMLRTMSKNGNQ